LFVTIVFCGAIVLSAKKRNTRPEIPITPEPVVTIPASLDVKIPNLPALPERDERERFTLPVRPGRSDIAKGKRGLLIVIDKGAHTMEVFQDGKTVRQYGIAVGKNMGDKERVGDMRTPEGEFPIVQIQNASGWTHDFRDGKGQLKGAYGPYFIRLGTPGWSGIGIHGTHAPDSIGTNVTEGCIRLSNEDVAELRRLVKIGDKVVIRN
jgi:lipoprotein-anchoring transpeptidase ErfK/SrfK